MPKGMRMSLQLVRRIGSKRNISKRISKELVGGIIRESKRAARK
jgi:hypothetical protein